MSKEIDTKIECCEIWNSLKDKTKMIDFLINAKTEIDQLKQENETLFLQLSKQEIDEHKPVYCTLAGNDCKYLGKIKELKQQLAEKDKEIEDLSLQIANLNSKITQMEEQDMVFHNQLAIQELAEVERLLYESHYKEIDNRYYAEYEDIKNLIDSRIQALEELKGEKDVED